MNNDNNIKELSVYKEDNVANLPCTADTAKAERVEKAAADYGKFESASALLAAYKSLEAEFTRRSQRLKELEEGNKVALVNSEPSPRGAERSDIKEAACTDEEIKRAVIEDYLKSVATNKSAPLISGGVCASVPKNSPKTVKEAGVLAETFLKNY